MAEIKISSNEFIPFEAMSARYGRAEFVVCPVFKRGKLVVCSIYPRQQPEVKDHWVWEGKADGLSFTGYQGLDNPKIWRTFWCKEHRCNSIELYVPNEAKFLWINLSVGSLGINFTKERLN
jgi:hypothetical protein